MTHIDDITDDITDDAGFSNDNTNDLPFENPAGDPALRRELLDLLLSLNFHSFTWCMAHLLERLGYADIRLVGRTGYVGHNNRGGYDMEARLPSALGERRVIVMTKQYDRESMVFRRTVDELRGACLRSGAAEGLILSTGPLAPSLSASVGTGATAIPAIAPVRVVDGEELAELLVLYGIGVVGDFSSGYSLDVSYFADLERCHPGGDRQAAQRADRANRTGSHRYLLTVGVETLDSGGKIEKSKRERRVARVIL